MGIEKIIGNMQGNPFSHKNAFILSLRISLLFNAILLLGFISRHQGPIMGLLIPIVYMFICNIFQFYFLFLINFKFSQMGWRQWLRALTVFGGSIIVSFLFSAQFLAFLRLFTFASPIEVTRYLYFDQVKSLVIFFIVQISTLLISLSKQEKEAALEHEKLHTENIRIRYEVLKSQIDPHFIFNSLNTLDGLIGVDDDGAHEYIQNFSSVFRYVINNKEVTQLSEELAFTESYAAMLKIRFGDNFNIEFRIDETFREWLIMPISLQLLVENAVKHNVISKNHPLLVVIETTEHQTIRVCNNINLKKEPEHGAGIGLVNLADRYDHLFHKKIVITQSDSFCVEIPLIK